MTRLRDVLVFRDCEHWVYANKDPSGSSELLHKCCDVLYVCRAYRGRELS